MRKNSSYLHQTIQPHPNYHQTSSFPIHPPNQNVPSSQVFVSSKQTQPKFSPITYKNKVNPEPQQNANTKTKAKEFLRHTTYVTKGQSLTDKYSISTQESNFRNGQHKFIYQEDLDLERKTSPKIQQKRRYKTYGKEEEDDAALKGEKTTSYIEYLKKKKEGGISQEALTKVPKISHFTDTKLMNSHHEKQIRSTNFQKNKEVSPYTIKQETMVSNQKQKRGFTPVVPLKKHLSPSKQRKNNCVVSDFFFGKMLGGGKFGTVFQAIHIKSKSMYAIKKVPKNTLKEYKMVDQFCLEVKLQTFLKHENILQLYGVFSDQDNIYLILEFMEEGTLYSCLKKHKKLTEEQVSGNLLEIAKALQHLHHNGIAHRDIKPQNIVISNGVCKLCDFGWATFCQERRKTYCGTFDYAAPQILQGVEYDISVDIWCFGVLAYELLVGKSPFYHRSRRQTISNILNVETKKIEYPPNLSKKAVSFIQSILKKNPEQRPNIDEVLKHPFLKMDQNSM